MQPFPYQTAVHSVHGEDGCLKHKGPQPILQLLLLSDVLLMAVAANATC